MVSSDPCSRIPNQDCLSRVARSGAHLEPCTTPESNDRRAFEPQRVRRFCTEVGEMQARRLRTPGQHRRPSLRSVIPANPFRHPSNRLTVMVTVTILGSLGLLTGRAGTSPVAPVRRVRRRSLHGRIDAGRDPVRRQRGTAARSRRIFAREGPATGAATSRSEERGSAAAGCARQPPSPGSAGRPP